MAEASSAELIAVEAEMRDGVLAGVGDGAQRAVVVVYLEVDFIGIFDAGIGESEAGMLLFGGGPDVAFEGVAEATGVIEVGVRERELREEFFGTEMIDVVVAEAAIVGFVNETVGATDMEIPAEVGFVVLVLFLRRWSFDAPEEHAKLLNLGR